jgi:hypothetical protein
LSSPSISSLSGTSSDIFPHLFLQHFELSNDHRGRRRLQPRIAVASGSSSHQRPRIRVRCHPQNTFHHSIADNHHRSKLAVDHLDVLAGPCLAGEPPLLLFSSCHRIRIARPRLDLTPEMVSTNDVVPCRDQSAHPRSIQSKSISNSNSNPCFVADLVKSIENKILSQKLQIIPRWNP